LDEGRRDWKEKNWVKKRGIQCLWNKGRSGDTYTWVSKES